MRLHGLVLVFAVLSLLSACACAAYDDEVEGEWNDGAAADPKKTPGPGLVGRVVVNVVLSVVSTALGFGVLAPFEHVRRSKEYARNQGGVSEMPRILGRVLPQLVTPGGLQFLLQNFLIFAPRLLIKFTVYGMIRGRGPANLAKVIVASLVSGVVTMLYVYPMRQVEHDGSLRTGSFLEVIQAVWARGRKRGFGTLYRGVLTAIPYMAVYNFLLFFTMELVAVIGKDKFVVNALVGAPLAVAAAAVLAAPLETLRRILVTYPPNYEELLFERHQMGERVFSPDWYMLRDYAGFVWDKWTENGWANFFGRVYVQINTVSIALSLLFHHQLLSL